jgi:hypothetical protein
MNFFAASQLNIISSYNYDNDIHDSMMLAMVRPNQ